MERTVILRAKTAQGFGGEEFYREQVVVREDEESMRAAKREFAIKYGVEIDSIEVL